MMDLAMLNLHGRLFDPHFLHLAASFVTLLLFGSSKLSCSRIQPLASAFARHDDEA